MKLKKVCSTIILIILLIQITTLAMAIQLDPEKEKEFSRSYDQKRFESAQIIIKQNEEKYQMQLLKQAIAKANPGDELQGYKIQGIITIPAIDVNLPILDETTATSINLGMTNMYTTAGLNKPGNTVLYNHTSSYYAKLGIGDEITIRDETETVTYSIYDKFVAKMTDTSFYDKSAEETKGKAEISIITASTTDDNEKNIIVAKEISDTDDEKDDDDMNDNENNDNDKDKDEAVTVDEPIEWTDFSNSKVTFELTTSGLKAQLTGITEKDNHSFAMEISSNKDNLSEENSEYSEYLIKDKEKNTWNTTIPNEAIALNKDYYFIIVEKSDMTNKKQRTTPVKMEFSLPKYGTRLDIWLFTENKCTATQSILSSTKYKRKLKYKIGRVTDNNLLRKFKTNEDEAYKELYDFAKKDTGETSGTIDVSGENNFNPASKLNITTDKAYYYAYLSLDDESGKYYPIDDIAIYQGYKNGKELYHFAFADMNVPDGDSGNNGGSTDNDPTSKDDPTIVPKKYPFTGKLGIGMGITTLIGATYILYKKNKEYEDVK